MHYPCNIILTSILLPTRKSPCTIHAFTSMHYPCIHIPCTIHAFNLAIHKKHNYTSSMHYPCTMYSCIFHATILLSTRNIIIHHSCIIHASCIHAFSCIANRALSFILIFTRSQAHHNIYLAIRKITIP